MLTAIRDWLREPVTPERAERLRRRHLVGRRRDASTWLLLYPIISIPMAIAIALAGYWYAALAFLMLIIVPGVYLLLLEYEVYPNGKDDVE